jgi:hypothetical protein
VTNEAKYQSKKEKLSKAGVVHIDSDIHKKLKIHCAANDIDMGKYATKVLRES